MNKLKAIGGFTLVELMIVIAIISFLSMISVPSFIRFLAKAKRSEAYMHLGSIYIAQKAYWAEHGKYASALSGPNGLGWRPDGYHGGGSDEQFNYTYGFSSGSEGTHHVTGKLNTPASALGATKADRNGFVIAAAGDIDGDGIPDVLTVDEHNTIKIVQDDLQ